MFSLNGTTKSDAATFVNNGLKSSSGCAILSYFTSRFELRPVIRVSNHELLLVKARIAPEH